MNKNSIILYDRVPLALSYQRSVLMNRIHSPFAWLIGLTAISFIVSGVATIGSHSGIGVLIILFTGFACVLVWAASLDYYRKPRLHTSIITDLWVIRRNPTLHKNFTLSDLADGGNDVVYMALKSGASYRLGTASKLTHLTARVGDLVTVKRTGGVGTGNWKAEIISVVPAELLPFAKAKVATSTTEA